MAPILPFVTDEVWSWWHDESIHAASWPTTAEVAPTVAADTAVLDAVGEVLSQVRRAKTEAKLSQRATVDRLEVHAPAGFLQALGQGEDDLRAAGGIVEMDLREDDSGPTIGVTLAVPAV